MGTRLDFITQEIVDRAASGRVDLEIKQAMSGLAALMLFPKDRAAYVQFNSNAFIRLELERFDALRKPTAAELPKLRHLIERQRAMDLGPKQLEEAAQVALRNGWARGLVFREYLGNGNNLEGAKRKVKRELPQGFDTNFGRNLQFIPVSHLWAAYSAFLEDDALPCKPENLAEFLAISRAFQIALEEMGKAEADFRIPDGLRLKSYMLRPVGERPRNSRTTPRRVVHASGEVRV